jgi:hypothetical protein
LVFTTGSSRHLSRWSRSGLRPKQSAWRPKEKPYGATREPEGLAVTSSPKEIAKRTTRRRTLARYLKTKKIKTSPRPLRTSDLLGAVMVCGLDGAETDAKLRVQLSVMGAVAMVTSSQTVRDSTRMEETGLLLVYLQAVAYFVVAHIWFDSAPSWLPPSEQWNRLLPQRNRTPKNLPRRMIPRQLILVRLSNAMAPLYSYKLKSRRLQSWIQRYRR